MNCVKLTAKPVFDKANPGWRRIAYGASKSAYLAPDKSCVVLCSYGTVHLDLEWYAYARASRNPHFVKVLEGPVVVEQKGRKLTMVKCEVLRPLPETLANRVNSMYAALCAPPKIAARRLRAIAKGGVHDLSVREVKDMAQFLRDFPSFYAAMYLVSRDASPRAGFMDFHSGNVMLRGSTLVLVDPWAVETPS